MSTPMRQAATTTTATTTTATTTTAETQPKTAELKFKEPLRTNPNSASSGIQLRRQGAPKARQLRTTTHEVQAATTIGSGVGSGDDDGGDYNGDDDGHDDNGNDDDENDD